MPRIVACTICENLHWEDKPCPVCPDPPESEIENPMADFLTVKINQKELAALRSSLSAAEKERQDLQEEVARLRLEAGPPIPKSQRFKSLEYALEKARQEASGAQLTFRQQQDRAILAEAERDTALREREEAREDVAMIEASRNAIQDDWREGCKKIAKLESILASIATALNCPSLPIEELAGKVGEVVEHNSRLNSWVDNDREIFIALGFPDPPGPTLADARNLVSRSKEAFTKGAELMRERAALSVSCRIVRYRESAADRRVNDTLATCAGAIRSLPIHPKEG